MGDWTKRQPFRFSLQRLFLATFFAAAALMVFARWFPRDDAGAPPRWFQIFAVIMLVLNVTMLVLVWPRSSSGSNLKVKDDGSPQ